MLIDIFRFRFLFKGRARLQQGIGADLQGTTAASVRKLTVQATCTALGCEHHADQACEERCKQRRKRGEN